MKEGISDINKVKVDYKLVGKDSFMDLFTREDKLLFNFQRLIKMNAYGHHKIGNNIKAWSIN